MRKVLNSASPLIFVTTTTKETQTMKYRLHPIAALLVTLVGIGSGYADDRGGQPAIATKHYSHVDSAFFSGGGFLSGPELYSVHETAQGQDAANSEVALRRIESGAHFSQAEYLLLAGTAFSSRPESYPFSW
jgi:hypothetical protein